MADYCFIEKRVRCVECDREFNVITYEDIESTENTCPRCSSGEMYLGDEDD
ncbi:MAG: hypothetical protein KKF44_09030 [Nanoarchaeota archaeon]|nr:hypothetical protein [Nanoarchaeota archaeon]